VTVAIDGPEPRRRWRTWAVRLVACRHPLLLAFALISTWSVRSDIDWKFLSAGGRGLFSSSPLSVYAKAPGLQAGPPSLVLIRGLNLLPGSAGLWIAHILLAFLGWYMIYLVERWTVAGSSWRAAPLGAGLLTLVVAVPVLEQWAWLAGDTPHPEDGLAIFTFLLAVRAIMTRRELRAAVLIGLAMAWKPWAVAALPLVLGCSRKMRALLIAVAVPAACWLPFVVGDHSTLAAVSHGLAVDQNSPLRTLGVFGPSLPDWWRTVELGGALAGAALAARRDWRVAFAAGCTMRLLLDPAAFGYYDAGLIMATALTERLIGARPWRTITLWMIFVYLPFAIPGNVDVIRFVGFGAVFLSWVVPWRRTTRDDGAPVSDGVSREPVPRQRDPRLAQPTTAPPGAQPASLPAL
jgi:hypothetical protein